MSARNVISLSILLIVVLILTGSVVGGVPASPVLGELAPILILALMTWYLIILIVNRGQLIAGLAAIFKLGRRREFARTNFWLTIAVYAAMFGLGIVALWTGLPQRILGRLQEMATLAMSGTQNTNKLPPSQSNPIARLFPATPFIYYGILVSAAICVVSFTLIIGGLRLAIKSRELRSDRSEEKMKVNAAEVLRQTITHLKSAKEYHETILQCYKRMCETLSQAGLEAAPEETAREFAESISAKLHIGEAVTGLTFLFEEARYSSHEISEDKRIMALNHLGLLQQALSPQAGMST
jgi:hypothetical protein